MNVIIDGIIYQIQTQGGISRIYSEVLPRMCELDNLLRITLLTEGKCRQSLPEHKHIVHRKIIPVNRYLRLGRLWKPVIPRARQLMIRLSIGRGDGQIWHSTYYTQPEPWDGLQVVTVADMIHERFSDLFSGLGNDQFREEKRRCVHEADAVICISEATRQDVLRFYKLDSNSTYVVPLACSDFFRQLGQRGDDSETLTNQPFLLYVGSRAHYKNFDRLIHAYSVWGYRNEVALVVVGNSWSASEELRLAELGIRDRVHLLTDVDDEELCQLYNLAVAFVYPSLYEGFGIPLLEAMACGCPVIASHVPSTIEVAGECPIYFEPTEMDELVNAFDVALSEGLDSERVEAGLEWVKQYSWDNTAAQTLDVYRTISKRLE